MADCAVFKATFRETTEAFHATFGEFHEISPDPYDGPFEIIPSQETQTLYTQDKSMPENVIIKPIPQNYGLITWNGAFLLVS